MSGRCETLSNLASPPPSGFAVEPGFGTRYTYRGWPAVQTTAAVPPTPDVVTGTLDVGRVEVAGDLGALVRGGDPVRAPVPPVRGGPDGRGRVAVAPPAPVGAGAMGAPLTALRLNVEALPEGVEAERLQRMWPRWSGWSRTSSTPPAARPRPARQRGPTWWRWPAT